MNTTMATITTAVIVAVLTLIFQKAFSNFVKGFSIFLTRPFKKVRKLHYEQLTVILYLVE